jgi:hypothetical protein
MDPFARKMVRGSMMYAAVLLVMFAILTVLYLHYYPRCSDQVISDAVSPDNHWAAAVMEGRCGQEAPFLTRVNLRPAGTSIKLGYFSGMAKDGEVFLTEQDAQTASVTLTWTAPDHLAISCAGCVMNFVRKRQERFGAVTISYLMGTR